ncbi:uncharacterized protein PV06_03953 [Exophiala oligosperma]|uniref:Exosome complex protein n=1 Tax=Exophiala oligosperma TaxID=215243 RepID=A0A0D2C731_9EURO|nr:uncharacterized protein PV06_03953 [Exophiala oligosperma]KIW45572.1 hypothetical protein PV06_03953 [Exophiala oligosperma]
METSSMLDLVDQLEENIEDLEDSLAPLLESGSSLASTTKKLPLVDRAKLDVLLVYAIESIIFSFLKLHGIDAKEHAVFRELSRVKPYFEKIKNAEAGASPSRPSAILNKEAANRVIRHALAGNAKYDLERAEREARDKFRANQKLKNLEASLQEKAKAQAQDEKPIDEKADALQLAAQLASLPQETSEEDSSSAENDKETAGAVDEGEASSIPKTESENLTESSPPQEISQETPQEKRRGKKRKSQQAEDQQPSKKSKKEEKKAKKKDRQEKKAKKAQKKTAAGTEDGG